MAEAVEKKPRKQRSDKGIPKKGNIAKALEPYRTSIEEMTAVAPDTPPSRPNETVDPDEKVFGFPVSEGFSTITLFPSPGEGETQAFVSLRLGDYPVLSVAKGHTHVLPNALIGVITATVVPTVQDDLSNPRNPRRLKNVMKTRFPHSPPIPATKEQFVAYYREQHSLEHPNDFYNRTSAR